MEYSMQKLFYLAHRLAGISHCYSFTSFCRSSVKEKQDGGLRRQKCREKAQIQRDERGRVCQGAERAQFSWRLPFRTAPFMPIHSFAQLSTIYAKALLSSQLLGCEVMPWQNNYCPKSGLWDNQAPPSLEVIIKIILLFAANKFLTSQFQLKAKFRGGSIK